MIASILDPAHKHLRAFLSEVHEAAYEHICKFVALEPAEKTANNAAKRHFSGLDFFLGDQYNDEMAGPTGESEFNLYLAEAVQIGTQFDALDWWKSHCNNYKRVEVLARRYLGVPPISVASERLFSLSGRVITKTRNRLLPETASAIVFLNKNMHALDCDNH